MQQFTSPSVENAPLQKKGGHDPVVDAPRKETSGFSLAQGQGFSGGQLTGNYPPSAIWSHAGMIQPKLEIGAPDDALEHEADAIADEVSNESLSTSKKYGGIKAIGNESVQRKCTDCEEKKVQRKPFSGANSGYTQPQLTHQIQSSLGGGQPMDGQTRGWMESGFGRDFSQVKIHTGNNAAQMNRDLNAKAFTVGNDIYFNEGFYQPHQKSGRHLLAHELTHTIQQQHVRGNPMVQKADFGGGMGAPANWNTQVAAATTSALQANLIQTTVGTTVTVSDRTTQSAADTSPDPAHLLPFTAAAPNINYDQALNSKTSRTGRGRLTNNAGYTFTHGGNSYVVLGSTALDSSRYYQTINVLNHELDHVRQTIAGSTLTGNASELDAWTSSFIREFHRNYVISESSGGNCFVSNNPLYGPLRGYYEGSGVTATDKSNALSRITAYFTSTIQPHAGHLAVFRYWLRKSLSETAHLLADDLIAALHLTIAVTDTLASHRQFSCTGITSLTFPASPTVSLPTFPATGGGGTPVVPKP